MQATITNAGYTAIQGAVAGSSLIDVTYAKIGSTIITPLVTMTDVDTLVHTGTSSELRITKLSTDSVKFRVTLPDTIGPFDIGNIGLFLTSGTMIAIASLDTVVAKEASAGASTGNTIILDIIVICSGVGSTINLTLTTPAGLGSVGISNSDSNLVIADSPLTSDGEIQVDLANNIEINQSLTVGSTLSNQLALSGSASASATTLTASGSDTNIDIDLITKGSGRLLVNHVPLRIRLTSDTTLYVSTSGSDSNSGLSAGSPFLTIQKAYDTIANNFDLSGYSVTIQLADGTYTSGLVASCGNIPGLSVTQNTITISGNLSIPGNVIISSTSDCILTQYSAQLQVKNFRVQSSAGAGLASHSGSVLKVAGPMIFGSCGSAHMRSYQHGYLLCEGIAYSIVGGSPSHYYAAYHSTIQAISNTVSAVGTVNFTQFFVDAEQNSFVSVPSSTFSGTVTGSKYNSSSNSTIYTNGAGASYLPGNVSGVTSLNGVYY